MTKHNHLFLLFSTVKGGEKKVAFVWRKKGTKTCIVCDNALRYWCEEGGSHVDNCLQAETRTSRFISYRGVMIETMDEWRIKVLIEISHVFAGCLRLEKSIA